MEESISGSEISQNYKRMNPAWPENIRKYKDLSKQLYSVNENIKTENLLEVDNKVILNQIMKCKLKCEQDIGRYTIDR